MSYIVKQFSWKFSFFNRKKFLLSWEVSSYCLLVLHTKLSWEIVNVWIGICLYYNSWIHYLLCWQLWLVIEKVLINQCINSYTIWCVDSCGGWLGMSGSVHAVHGQVRAPREDLLPVCVRGEVLDECPGLLCQSEYRYSYSALQSQMTVTAYLNSA